MRKSLTFGTNDISCQLAHWIYYSYTMDIWMKVFNFKLFSIFTFNRTSFTSLHFTSLRFVNKFCLRNGGTHCMKYKSTSNVHICDIHFGLKSNSNGHIHTNAKAEIADDDSNDDDEKNADQTCIVHLLFLQLKSRSLHQPINSKAKHHIHTHIPNSILSYIYWKSTFISLCASFLLFSTFSIRNKNRIQKNPPRTPTTISNTNCQL